MRSSWLTDWLTDDEAKQATWLRVNVMEIEFKYGALAQAVIGWQKLNMGANEVVTV